MITPRCPLIENCQQLLGFCIENAYEPNRHEHNGRLARPIPLFSYNDSGGYLRIPGLEQAKTLQPTQAVTWMTESWI